MKVQQPRVPPLASRSVHLRQSGSPHGGDARGQTLHQQAPVPTPVPFSFRPQLAPIPPPPLRHLSPAVAAAAHLRRRLPRLPGFGGQGVVAFPSAVQQQVFVEGVPVREPPLPFCGVGIGWFLFLLGFFLAAIPWYAGAFLLFFVALDHREKPGLIACTIAAIFALVSFILNGIRMHPFW
ncbi:hypothetical protein SETIT_J012600v2 [Setaria italica]|uniref:60S ribosomal protein L18a-like protein n=1 Tax=Setaria italica TaxID=4555 RepID=A0A368PFE4_SETIT|nr:hypothetical protein SETIT_J012600v2 [Setaria italica]